MAATMGESEKAKEYLQRAVKKDPKNAVAWNNYAWIVAQDPNGDLDDALAAVNKATGPVAQRVSFSRNTGASSHPPGPVAKRRGRFGIRGQRHAGLDGYSPGAGKGVRCVGRRTIGPRARGACRAAADEPIGTHVSSHRVKLLSLHDKLAGNLRRYLSGDSSHHRVVCSGDPVWRQAVGVPCSPSEIVIVAARGSRESEGLARYYARVRGVPAKNLCLYRSAGKRSAAP